MPYEENQDSKLDVLKEVACSWILAASLVALVFIVLDTVH